MFDAVAVSTVEGRAGLGVSSVSDSVSESALGAAAMARRSKELPSRARVFDSESLSELESSESSSDEELEVDSGSEWESSEADSSDEDWESESLEEFSSL